MDLFIAQRLVREPDFREKVTKLASEYIKLGRDAVDYWTGEFDAAHDLLMAYAPLTKADLDNLEKGHPKRWVLPMASTQITTMATFIAQMLFGDDQPHKVEGRGPEDETAAGNMNQLLRWNAEQQPTYLLGYLWVLDALTYNRGVMYDSWAAIYDLKVTQEEVELPDVVGEDGKARRYLRLKKQRVPVGGFCRIDLVSPYDFFCDPSLPLWRFQEGRFAGHRSVIPWTELKRRSSLPEEHPEYVLPDAVDALKENPKRQSKLLPPTSRGAGANKTNEVSRTAYERDKQNSSVEQRANKNDPGTIETYEVYIRLCPKTEGLGEGEEPSVFQFVLAGDQVLAINEAPNQHDNYPYSAAEGRPSEYQFSPGWMMMLKAIQDYVDYFKNRRQQALTRTLGNIFIARTDKVNLTDFLDPDKEGLVIPVLPEGAGDELDDIVKQVQVNDITQNFHSEMMEFVKIAETVSGANNNMQGQVAGDGTATEFAGTQQMSAGRMASTARLLSVQGVAPQTRRLASNFQQFLSDDMSIRFRGSADSVGALGGLTSLQITRDVIQGRFDYVVHDGTLPGTDGRKVAAMTRLLDAAAAFPQFFTPAPGNLDARAMMLAAAKASGLNIENFQFKQDQPTPQPPAPAAGALPDLSPDALGGIPGRGPGRPAQPSATQLPRVGPPQIRPQNL